MNKPPESIFYAIKGLYTLLSNLIESPPFKLKFEWKFYQELLHSRIPDVGLLLRSLSPSYLGY